VFEWESKETSVNTTTKIWNWQLCLRIELPFRYGDIGGRSGSTCGLLHTWASENRFLGIYLLALGDYLEKEERFALSTKSMN